MVSYSIEWNTSPTECQKKKEKRIKDGMKENCGNRNLNP